MKINQLLDEIDLPKRYFSEAFIIGEKFEEEASKYLTLLDNCDECDLDADKKAEFNEKLKKQGIPTETGIFGADMKVDIQNDGPVTILLDSKKNF